MKNAICSRKLKSLIGIAYFTLISLQAGKPGEHQYPGKPPAIHRHVANGKVIHLLALQPLYQLMRLRIAAIQRSSLLSSCFVKFPEGSSASALADGYGAIQELIKNRAEER